MMLIGVGVLVFFTIVSLSLAVVNARSGNSLAERFGGTASGLRFNLRFFMENRLWETNKASSVMTFDQALMTAAVSAAVSFLLITLFLGAFFGFLAAFAVFAFAPPIVNQIMVQSRVKKFKDNLEAATAVMVGCLQAGFTLSEAVRETMDVAPAGPLRVEFARVYHQMESFNMAPEDAFKNMAERIPCSESAELHDAIELYQNIGGPQAVQLLNQSLQNMRKAQQAKYEVDQHLRSVKNKVWFTIGFPAIYVLGMMLMSPGFLSILFTTSLGHVALIICLFIYFTGAGILYNLIKNIESF